VYSSVLVSLTCHLVQKNAIRALYFRSQKLTSDDKKNLKQENL